MKPNFIEGINIRPLVHVIRMRDILHIWDIFIDIISWGVVIDIDMLYGTLVVSL